MLLQHGTHADQDLLDYSAKHSHESMKERAARIENRRLQPDDHARERLPDGACRSGSLGGLAPDLIIVTARRVQHAMFVLYEGEPD